MANEIKVGILGLVTILAFIWGYNFIKGKDILRNMTHLYVEYENINNLTQSAPVILNGRQLGLVSSIDWKDDYSGKNIITLEIDQNFPLPKSTVARIVDLSIMGGKGVELHYDAPCSGEDCAQNGDYLQGNVVSFVGAMTEELDPYLKQASGTLESIDSLINSAKGSATGAMNGKGIGEMVKDFQTILGNLATTSRSLNKLMLQSSENINGTFSNLNAITQNIEKNNAQITQLLANTAAITENFKNTDIKKAVSQTTSTLATAETTIKNLESTLQSANTALASTSKLMNSINDSEGLMKLLDDKDLADNLRKASINVNLLLEDFRLNPKRYIRLFKAKNKPYEVPTNDPAKPLLEGKQE